ncbi:MAG TPA: hypothetical protein VEQ60_18490 [Longimicrobium sp.]|nr:hypothetical protein [Longimicrobium sp.]
MKKMKLELEQLAVDSFDTSAAPERRGTVYGRQVTDFTHCTCPGHPSCDGYDTCQGPTCDAFCTYTQGDPSCDITCHGRFTCEPSCDYTCPGYGATCEYTCGCR